MQIRTIRHHTSSDPKFGLFLLVLRLIVSPLSWPSWSEVCIEEKDLLLPVLPVLDIPTRREPDAPPSSLNSAWPISILRRDGPPGLSIPYMPSYVVLFIGR